MARPRFTALRDGALLARHPITGILTRWARQDASAYTPHPLDTSLLARDDEYLLGTGLVREQALLVNQTQRTLELRTLPALALSERVTLQAGVEGMWSSGRYIYQMTTSPPRLLVFDMETSRRTSRAISGFDVVLDAHLSSCGTWLAMAGLHHERVTVRIYALHDPLYPLLHLDGLDVRGIHSPLSSLAMADLSVWCMKETLFLCLSRLGAESATWPGWRASVACVDLVSGKLGWHAELDAEITGDWRGIAELERDRGFAPAMCASAQRLWVGSQDASVWEFDARDGALRQAHHYAGAHGTLAMHHDTLHDELVLMNERGQVHALAP